MRVTEKVTPILAMLSAIGTLACCLPIGGVALLGLGGVVGAMARNQQWLLPASALLLVVGGLQVWRSRRVCQRTSRVSVVILAISTVVVALVAFFPQLVAGLLTDWLS